MSNIQEFNYGVDLLQAILWQYDKADRLKLLLTEKSAWWFNNQSLFWNDWYDDVFNVQTANSFGLSVWSIILGIPFLVPLTPDPNDKPVFGFNDYDPTFPTLLNTYLNFTNSNFSNAGSSITLTLEEQRLIIKLRYYQLISRGSIESFVILQGDTYLDFQLGINNILNNVFGVNAPAPYNDGAWVLDGLDMTMTYVFNFDVPLPFRQVLVGYDLLPRPAGVGLKYIVLTGSTFGFGATNQNFGNGNYIPGSFI